MRDTFLFDLDGTLLPMDFKEFMTHYFQAIGTFFKDNIDPLELMNKINETTEYTIKTNDGRTNEDIFVEHFNKINSSTHEFDMDGFYTFYNSTFEHCKQTTWQDEDMIKSVHLLKEKGYRVAVATNPLLPLVSNHHRIRWAGFEPEDFEYISSFEGNKYCKPFVEFYSEVCDFINKDPKECFMVGNDASEDLVAAKLGIETYLITDCYMDSHKLGITPNHQGTYKDFYAFVRQLDTIKK